MDDLPKITLRSERSEKITAQKIAPDNTRMRGKKFIFPKKLLVVLAILLVLFVGLTIVLLAPFQRTYSSAKSTNVQAHLAWDAIKKQNITLADEELAKTKVSLAQTQNNLHGMSFVRFIPIAAWYYNDADHMLSAGGHALDAGTVVLSAIKPYADVLGLKGQGSFVGGSAEQRIQTAILTLGKITPRIDDVAKDFQLAQQDIDQVDPNHYPSIFGLGKVKTQLTSVKKYADEGVIFVTQARPLIKVLPSLLGESKPKKYLILFQNANELRPTGGFLTAYAIFNVDKGKISVDKSDDIYNLDNSIPNSQKPKAPAPILKYLANVPILNIRDTNISPDFIESMKTFNSLYDKSKSKTDVDGIIALDSNVLVSTIKILDDNVAAGGITFTTKNDSRCNCPEAIYKLESLISTPKSLDIRVTSLAAVQAQRKDILGTLLFAIMQKALKSSPKLYWGPLMQDMITQSNEKHILFDLYNSGAQQGIEALNVAGKIKSFDGDYFHFNEANLGGAKSNLFVKESVLEEIKTESNGTITQTVTVNYKNPFPPSDCNLERGNLCLNGVLRDWFRVYVPKGSQLVSSQGSEVKVTSYEDLGKTVFDGFLTVRPAGTATLTLSYTLPFKLNSGSPLPFLIQKQPGTLDNQYTIKVNGKTIADFPLLTDKELMLKP